MVTGNNLQGLIAFAGNILNSLIPLMIALALVGFFCGLVQYIINQGDNHDKGKSVMIAGLVALFVMVSVWGIIRLAQNTLGVSSGGTVDAPYVNQR